MAPTKNPFTAALEGFAVDPEAQAKGQVYLGQTAKLGNENKILSDRIAARSRMLADPNTPPHIRDMLLANEVVDATKATGATREFFGTNTLFPGGKPATNLTPEARSAGLAAWGINPNDNLVHGLSGQPGLAPSNAAAKDPDVHMVDGVPHVWTNVQGKDANGKVFTDRRLMPAAGVTTQTLAKPVVPGDKPTVVNKRVGEGGKIEVSYNTPEVKGGQVISVADLMRITEERRKQAVTQLGTAAMKYPSGPYAFLLDRQLGRIDEAGNAREGVASLNPLEANSIINLATELANSGYNPLEAFNLSLEMHPKLKTAIQAGTMATGDFDRGYAWNPFSGTDTYQSGGKTMNFPHFGGDFAMSPGFVPRDSGDYSNRVSGTVPVPSDTVIVSQPDLASAVSAGVAIRPRFASPVPSDMASAKEGDYYYSGTSESPRFVVARQQDGKVVLVPVTGIQQ
jgi:hypothetical protein